MRYRVDFPIPQTCNLKCFYCFHSDYYLPENERQCEYSDDRGFTFDEWKTWRDRHLKDAEELILNIHGGETFFGENAHLVFALIEECIDSMQTYEFLTNGICQQNEYKKILIPFAKKIKRIGFTFHRAMIADKPELVERFEENVLFVHDFDVPVYVKELLRVKDKEAILEYKEYWKAKGIDFKVQDYKGDNQGADFSEYVKYSGLDKAFVDQEYHHPMNKFCTCMPEYKCFGIRGYDFAAGEVVACWQDPVVVGNIKEGWFNPNFRVDRVMGTSERNVVGVPKQYSQQGTNPHNKKDRPNLGGCKT